MLTILIKTCVLFGFVIETNSLRYRNQTCGIDKAKASMVYQGIADIEDYPWMGTLFYPFERGRMTTSVVLVTKQIVLGSAKEIDTLPKHDIRSRCRVVLGSDCSGQSLKIREYALHPDYQDYPHSTIAMVQLEVDNAFIELRPICSPPSYLKDPEFYAMVAGDCNKAKMRIFKMKYVPQEKCQNFYRKSGWISPHLWPRNTMCARAVSPALCRWRSGAALVIKQDGRWRLLGFGFHGPGCRSPARFLDYGAQLAWLRSSVARVGLPAVTRMADNHLIVRRSLGNLQRFGHCDIEEKRHLLYRDEVMIEGTPLYLPTKTSYNLTLVANTEYACVILRAKAMEEEQQPVNYDPEEETKNTTKTNSTELCRDNPSIYLRRWCADSTAICHGFQFIEINFFVDIQFVGNTVFTITAYGKMAKVIDAKKALRFANRLITPVMVHHFSYSEMLAKLIKDKDKGRRHTWFYN